MKKKICALALCTTLFACGGGSGSNDTPTQSQQPTQNQSQVQQQQAQIAKDYVAEVLQIMRENVITKYEINWAEVEAEVMTMASDAQTISDTYPAITKALELIKTNHSFLYSRSDELVAYHSTLSCNEEVQIPFVVELDNVGYVKVGGFSDPDSDAILSFATGIQSTIARQDTAGIDGWVVDLRENTGGNMWPMIAGLGPLLGDGIHGYFVDADEQYINWGYEDGTSFIEDTSIVTVEQPYILLNPEPKIAVLSSKIVGSSGEATLIAFLKQDNVRVFGTDSCGLSTANQAFPLSDGSTLFLTTAIMADREQTKYGNRVPVDQSEEHSVVIEKAVEWIKNG